MSKTGKNDHGPLKRPFKDLGQQLRILRQQQKASLDEVSGAVEIDPGQLNRIEVGEQRPSEDVLFLLFSYFDVDDQTALDCWSLAGYDPDNLPQEDDTDQDYDPDADDHDNDRGSSNQRRGGDDQSKRLPSALEQLPPIAMLLALDPRIVYTNRVNVAVDDHGVVLSFMQQTGNSGQSATVARVGMSREHAKRMMEILAKTVGGAGTETTKPISQNPKQKPDNPQKA